jgi:hypothetical protein
MKTNPINSNRLNHDQLSNLRPGDLITIDGESGYSGYPMRFEYIVGPFVYVTVDTRRNGTFDYKTHYRIVDYDFYWMGKNPVESETVKTGARPGYGTETFQEIVENSKSGCPVAYHPDDSMEATLTVIQLFIHAEREGIKLLKVNDYLYYILDAESLKVIQNL